MALISFVLAVHREQAYLRECAASILDQGPGDVELVAVDDASPDHVPELLDDLAERDDRVRVRRLERRAGTGEARNLGLEDATGDFVWFANTTDRLPPGAIAAVVERLRGDDPDVLLVQHTHTGPLGKSRQGPHGELLAGVAERRPGTLDDHPRAATAAPRVWAKVFRRALLDELGVRFGRGREGELGVTWAGLLTAERIAALETPAYDRRRPPNAVRDELVEGTPFDVFAAHDSAIEAARGRGVPPHRLGLAAGAMFRHELSLLEHMPDAERREFFERMADAQRHRSPSGEPVAGGRAMRARRRLVRHGAFRLLEATQRRRARGRDPTTAPPKPNKRPAPYEASLREPLDPNLAAFAAYWYRGYSCNPRAIYERARELVPDMRGVWVVKPEEAAAFPAGVEHVIAGSDGYWDLIARAAYLVNNVNWPNYLVKREGSVHVMTHHGTPLKRMGLDLQGRQKAGKPTDFAALLRRCGRWDYSITQNAHTTLIWERVYPTPYETLEVGYPRNDRLANATDEDVERVRAELGIEPGRRAILYAPTHREYLTEWQPTLDLAALADGLGEEFVIMARLHYLYESDAALTELHRQGRIRDVAGHPSVEELSLAADALLTDYSSIMFDYAVLDRPIVIHAPDWDTYRTMRGTYFDLTERPPGLVTRTEGEVIEALRSGAAWGDGARRLRAAFRPRFCSLDDGRAAERVVRRVWLGEPVPPAPGAPARVAT